MKLTREQAAKQAKRLQANALLIPQSPEGKTEIIECLIRHCDSPEHAERTMTELLDGAKDPRNITAEIAEAARLTRKGPGLPEGCDRCRVTDPFTGEVKYLPYLGEFRNGYDRAFRCACARGKALAALDAKRGMATEKQDAKKAATVQRAEDWAKLAAGDSGE